MSSCSSSQNTPPDPSGYELSGLWKLLNELLGSEIQVVEFLLLVLPARPSKFLINWNTVQEAAAALKGDASEVLRHTWWLPIDLLAETSPLTPRCNSR